MSALKEVKKRWIKEPVRRLIQQYRLSSWRSRSLPDFIIIGAQKSGTTSLSFYLGQHPQILRSCKKEVHFFDGGLDPDVDNFEKGREWYQSHFPFRANVGANCRTFEATPLYIFNPLAPKRIFDLVPEVKLVAVLRNPTERAISHYFHEKRKGRESLPIMDAMLEEEERLKLAVASKYYKNVVYHRCSYKSRGLYSQQIERFLDYFPRQQILVLSSEELFREPDSTLRRVFEFIGVDPGFKVSKLRPRNTGKNKSEVDSEVYEYLNNYFLPHNQALYDLLGRSYEWEK